MTMVRARAVALLTVITSSLVLGACDTQFADPVLLPTETADPCAKWSTAAECSADSANACSLQPNPSGCLASDPSCAVGECRSGDPFVRRSGSVLSLHGKPYRFAGTNAWGVAWSPDCRFDSFDSPEAAIEKTFDDLASMRAGVLRLWAYQSYAGASGVDYANFDLVVRHARRAGVRLIFVLESMWSSCTRGGQKDDAWFRSGFSAPYGGYALSFPDYARGLVQHFRNEPTVLAWEIMHEAGGTDVAALDGFVDQMSTLIRINDANHLISIGMNNGSSDATSFEGTPSNYAVLHAHPTVDLLDVHDFGNPDLATTDSETSARAVAQSLGKPIFVGAAAVELSDTSASAFTQRANRVAAKLEAAYQAGFVGALAYEYYPGWSVPGTPFDARPEEPLAGPSGVLARSALRFAGP
ncbi:MAG TPA: cellulase family glycosylhydrolase [Polyangiaceae bacterium]|nr:cellulase family glycosylhydrolase [Polyangiaceae bacterium]